MSDEMIPTPEKKKPGRPKGYRKPVEVPPALPASGMTPEQMLSAFQLLAEAIRGNKEVDQEIAATIHAKAMKKALRPENEISPMISAYSYPEGDTAHPRPKPSHIFMMGPYPICDPGNYDCCTYTELELLEQVKPGAYHVTKADGTDVKMLVKREEDAAGKAYRTILFADGTGIRNDEEKNNWPPLMQILIQIVTGEAPTQSYSRYQKLLADREAEIATLKTQLAASTAA